MGRYKPLKIAGFETGLVQEREDFLLPFDGFPVLEDAFVWRERIKRKQGFELLARLRRVLTSQSLSNTLNLATYNNGGATIFTTLSLESTAEIQTGSLKITFDKGGASETILSDSGDGTLAITATNNLTATGGTINYATGAITVAFAGVISAAIVVEIDFNYYPGLPVMGLRQRERNAINAEQLIVFDTKYAYILSGEQFVEFITGTTWTGNNSDFFWSTNYWVDGSNNKLFWTTNFSGVSGDPIRYTNGTTWTTFTPQIDASANLLTQCRAMLPFRGRLFAFNTFEGTTLGLSVQKFNRIRWSAIGSPLLAESFREDIVGKGGFLDIPTAQHIVGVGFVRDNLVIYCERSTWQLRYSGNNFIPVQVEKVNTELGAESTFSTVNFDTSLLGVGDKGVVECDSFKSERIDIKIPDIVQKFNNDGNSLKRVHGVRDLSQRLVYWIFPDASTNGTFPDKRLVYNYENQAWAIHNDSLTALGTYQRSESKTWESVTTPWSDQNYSWVAKQKLFPTIVGGNQQGFVLILDQQVTNDPSLTITAVTPNDPDPTVITSANHNLKTNNFIKISEIPTGSGYDDLNDKVFRVTVINANTFSLYQYDTATETFIPYTNSAETYIGGGRIEVRDNFRIVSKKFENMDEGQQVQIGHIDVLAAASAEGAITMKIYVDYLNDPSINNGKDPFFNVTMPTSAPSIGIQNQSKYWHRVYCNTRGNMLEIEWTLSDAQMAGVEQENEVQIDAQVLWTRLGGRLI